MKIVVFGLTISSSWGNGHATLLRGLFEALGKRNHSVIFFERDVPYYAQHRDLVTFPGIELRLYDEWENVRRDAQREIDDADVAIVTSYCPDGIAATDLVISSNVDFRVFYDLDTPVTLEAIENGEKLSYIGHDGLAGFDLVLSYTGGLAPLKLKEKLGAHRVVPLYGSVNPDVHHAVSPYLGFESDLSYLGTYASDRQARLDSLFINVARRQPTRKFMIGGSKYPQDFPWLGNIWYLQHVSPDKHAAFYSSSPLTVNVTRHAMAQMGYCPSGRLFEAAACGTAIVTDSWEGIDQFFEPRSEIIIAQTTEDVVDALSMSHEEIMRIGAAGRERVLSSHTAKHRALELEAILHSSISHIPGANITRSTNSTAEV